MLSIFRSVAPVVRSHFRCISTVKTALYDKHVEMGAKMVPFAGYEMPVQVFSVVVVASHCIACVSSPWIPVVEEFL